MARGCAVHSGAGEEKEAGGVPSSSGSRAHCWPKTGKDSGRGHPHVINMGEVLHALHLNLIGACEAGASFLIYKE